jgi:hypothetical protein
MNKDWNKETESGRPQIINNVSINGPIGTYIAHVDTLNLNSKGTDSPQHQMPTQEQMCQIVEKMMDDGLWYAGRAWAVVFRLYQIWGYQGKYSDFVKEVTQWPFKRHKPTDCNDDAVSKPLRSGKYTDSPSMWLAKGAPIDAVRLGLAIEAELTKILPLF